MDIISGIMAISTMDSCYNFRTKSWETTEHEIVLYISLVHSHILPCGNKWLFTHPWLAQRYIWYSRRSNHETSKYDRVWKCVWFEYLFPVLLCFHRALLYIVVEDLLANFGMDGKACLLRAICEVHGQSLHHFGLIGEIVKLFFT